MSSAHRPATDKVAKCIKAMELVYGPFAHLSPTGASTWVPRPMAEGHQGRYLWTDAFGVLNFLTLGSLTHSQTYTTLAARLIHRVHDVLGRTRDGTQRLPGATDAHPLRGGLRIGKEKEEDDPSGDGDGQYHHYLTIWMFALHRMARAAGAPRYNDLAIELAQAIHPRFVWHREADRPRMCWKMSVDLSRPLVRSEGSLDPIHGYVVYSLLQRADEANSTVLAQEIGEYKKMLDTKWRRYISTDPLDLGMTLWTAHFFDGEEEWATELTNRALSCTRVLFEDGYFDQPTSYRLAFREFGICLGIQCHCEAQERCLSAEEKRQWNTHISKVISTWEPVIENSGPAAQRDELRSTTLVTYTSALASDAYNKGFFDDDRSAHTAGVQVQQM